ncbi:hypothetical protein GPECTOR_6g564 [Gonium pectorale]|uniref:C-type lectin domain-containing protein n=1 Tax=Gonium pectorale TaxID=33097 RepID=A0A150GUU1_GONPE|nr:hypothetical protein GPECTOR_6g564 [Gonium pectorale]|eukprot:KXZ53647.1 hypothetical protein GPECTOR_6g564 [Gonium pectorale]
MWTLLVPPTRARVFMPNAAKEYEAYKYKDLLLIATNKKYTYVEAQDYCKEKGYGLIPYNRKDLLEPTDPLCYQSKKGCWVSGRDKDFCAYIDPKGDGGPYARKCKEKQHAVYYTKWLKLKKK